MMGNWWQHRMDAESRQRDICRDVERERLARQLPGPSSLAVDHWMLELLIGVTGVSAGVFALLSLL